MPPAGKIRFSRAGDRLLFRLINREPFLLAAGTS